MKRSTTFRRWCSILAVAVSVAGLAEVTAAPAQAATAVRPTAHHAKATHRAAPREAGGAAQPNAIVCSATVSLGTTSACDLPAGGGTAEYTFTVPSADMIRMRAVMPGVNNVPDTLALSTSGGTSVCSQMVQATQVECAVSSAGDYRVDVTVNAQVTVYTTIDSIQQASCDPAPDLTVGAPGTAVDIADPSGSWCAALAGVPAHAVLDLTLDVNGDEGLDVRVYAMSGKKLCTASDVTAFARTDCTVSGGAGYRVFATPYDSTPQDAVLIATRESNPNGCGSGAPDAFGVPASRQDTLAPHQEQCYTFAANATDGLGVHLYAVDGVTSSLAWKVRDAAGTAVCAGGVDARLTSCPDLPATGNYGLFVSTLARDSGSYLVSLVDFGSAAGCAHPRLAWTSGPTAGTLDAGQVDCESFTTTASGFVRAALYGADGFMLISDHGHVACIFIGGGDCAVSIGTYRLVTFSSLRTSASYRVWLINMSDSAGCTRSTPDTFGVAPQHAAVLDANTLSVCFTISVPADSVYWTRAASATLDTTVDILTDTGSHLPCSGLMACHFTDAGTYLVVVYRTSLEDPASSNGTAAVGLYRVDQPQGCVQLGTSFTDPAASGTLALAQVDCHVIGAQVGDSVVVRAVSSQARIATTMFDHNGGPEPCSAAQGGISTCDLYGAGGQFKALSAATAPGSVVYEIRIASISHPTGCTALPASPFGRAPAHTFALSDPADMRCFRISIPGTAPSKIAMRTVDVQAAGELPSVDLFRPPGAAACQGGLDFQTCDTDGPGPFVMVATGNDPATGTIGWYDFGSTAGCIAGPSLAFGQAPTPANISRRGSVVCLTLPPLLAGDVARFAFAPTPKGSLYYARVIGPSGLVPCPHLVGDFDSSDPAPLDCGVGSPVTARVIVWADDAQTTRTGAFGMHAWRLNEPTGCEQIGTLRDGFGPLVGELADRNDEVCYEAWGGPGTLSITTSNDDIPPDVPELQIRRSSTGRFRCSVVGSGLCSLFGNGNYLYELLVRRNPQDADIAGHYRVEGTCTTTHCGP